MSDPKTSMGMPPIVIGGVTIRPLRVVRFFVGLGLIIHAFAWTIRYFPITVWGVEVAVGLLMVDPELFKLALTARKSRNGR